MNRELRLEKALKLAWDICNDYTWDKYTKLLDLCSNDISYCEDGENGFCIEDEHFTYIN